MSRVLLWMLIILGDNKSGDYLAVLVLEFAYSERLLFFAFLLITFAVTHAAMNVAKKRLYYQLIE